MSAQDFYETIFPYFWRDVDRDSLAEDANSMFGDPEVFDWIIKRVRPKEIIEIGSWKGHSANYVADICRNAKIESRILCVDTFLGSPEHWLIPELIEELHRKNGQPTIFNAFLANTLARRNTDMVFPFCIDSPAASLVLSHFDFRADLIFVDAAHDYDAVSRDILNFHPLLSAEGVMFGDDYQCEPLALAVHACAEKLGMQVLVHARKWIFLNEALVRKCTLPEVQLRTSFDGWVHP